MSTIVGRSASVLTRHPIITIFAAYVAMRVVNAGALAFMGSRDEDNPRHYFMSWDSGWFLTAAEQGWPESLPVNGEGQVLWSTWAWPPLVPLLARGGAAVVPSVGPGPFLIILNLVGGLLAALALWQLLAPYTTPRVSVGSALVWLALPATPVFVMGYTEGPFLALAFAALWAADRRRLVLSALLLLVASLVKVQVIPFALAVLIVILVEWRRRSRPLSTTRIVSAAVLATLSMVLWPLVVAVHFGSLTAYGNVQSAWHRSPVPFFDSLAWMGWAVTTDTHRSALFSLVIVLLAVVAGAVVVRSRNFPLALRSAAVTVPGFLLAAGAGISTSRLFLADPAVPVVLVRLAHRWWSALALGLALLVGQAIWIFGFVAFAPGFTMP